MILIDNGHSSQTPGKRSPLFDDGVTRFYEWEYNRRVARELHKRLCAEGICSVLLVPEDDYDVPLAERAARANKYGKDSLFISIHCNACGDGKTWNSGRGWAIYTSKGTTKSDRIATVFWNEAKKTLEPLGMSVRKDYSDGDPDNEANFAVLVKTNMPAVLTENLFMTNKEDVKFLLSDEGFDAIVNIHLNAIKECIKLGYYVPGR